MVGGKQKILKLHWIKCRKTVPKKRNFAQKNLTHFTSLILLNITKNILLVGVTKKEKHLHCTSSRHPSTAFSKHLEIKCLYIPVNRSYKIFAPEMQEAFIWCGLNNFFQLSRCLGLVKCFKIIILIKIFGISTNFQHFVTSTNSIKTLNFSRQFGVQG